MHTAGRPAERRRLPMLGPAANVSVAIAGRRQARRRRLQLAQSKASSSSLPAALSIHCNQAGLKQAAPSECATVVPLEQPCVLLFSLANAAASDHQRNETFRARCGRPCERPHLRTPVSSLLLYIYTRAACENAQSDHCSAVLDGQQPPAAAAAPLHVRRRSRPFRPCPSRTLRMWTAALLAALLLLGSAAAEGHRSGAALRRASGSLATAAIFAPASASPDRPPTSPPAQEAAGGRRRERHHARCRRATRGLPLDGQPAGLVQRRAGQPRAAALLRWAPASAPAVRTPALCRLDACRVAAPEGRGAAGARHSRTGSAGQRRMDEAPHFFPL